MVCRYLRGHHATWDGSGVICIAPTLAPRKDPRMCTDMPLPPSRSTLSGQIVIPNPTKAATTITMNPYNSVHKTARLHSNEAYSAQLDSVFTKSVLSLFVALPDLMTCQLSASDCLAML
jgi:hypothetical protein